MADQRVGQQPTDRWIPDPTDQRQLLDERHRARFLARAEEECLRHLGRRMTLAELESVITLYPGDRG